MNYKEYVQGKTVCFVGGSPILKGKNMGEYIDSHDIVIRTNGSVNLIQNEEFIKDYGKKIDVLYTNNQFYREMSPLPVDNYKANGVKWMCMKTCKEKDFHKFNSILNCRGIMETMKYVNTLNPTATMGAYIFTDIIKCKPAKFYVTGIDFFASKKKVFEHDNYQEYFEGYLPDKIRKQGNEINKGKTEDGHNFKENAEYIYNLWKRHDNMVFPDFIEEIIIGIIEGRIDQK